MQAEERIVPSREDCVYTSCYWWTAARTEPKYFVTTRTTTLSLDTSVRRLAVTSRHLRRTPNLCFQKHAIHFTPHFMFFCDILLHFTVTFIPGTGLVFAIKHHTDAASSVWDSERVQDTLLLPPTAELRCRLSVYIWYILTKLDAGPFKSQVC